MDKKTEALKLALEYLRDNQHYIADNERHAYVMEYNAFIESLKRLSEQPAQQPAAWMYDTTLHDGEVIKDWTSVAHPLDVTLPDENVHNIRPLYAAPASKPWVCLSDKQIVQLSIEWPAETNDWASHIDFAHAIEDKLKELNT